MLPTNTNAKMTPEAVTQQQMCLTYLLGDEKLTAAAGDGTGPATGPATG